MPHKATVALELKNRRMLYQASNRPIEYAQVVAFRANYRHRCASEDSAFGSERLYGVRHIDASQLSAPEQWNCAIFLMRVWDIVQIRIRVPRSLALRRVADPLDYSCGI